MKNLLSSILLLTAIMFASFWTLAKKPCLADENENITWLKSFTELTTKQAQLEAIKLKVMQDSLCSNTFPTCAGVGREQTSQFLERNKNVRRPPKQGVVFMLALPGSMVMLDWQEKPKTKAVLELLTPSNIDTIEIDEHVRWKAIYGSSAMDGIILLKSNNADLAEKID
ncbi:hypothetical protein [Persicobacter diffluens]|uniref:Uncharacterized protein n=1 Tax=Persicobacter diffluens TaxID=981 RepID=A0AAN4VZG7_9BACT|nr:hypothetical protein PEDI_34760 [Persicobacter diffluens]